MGTDELARSASPFVTQRGQHTWICNGPKYRPNLFCASTPMSLKSWPRKTTTPLSAISRASSSFCRSLSCDSCSPRILVPITGVNLVALMVGSFLGKRFGFPLLATRPRSINSKGWRGGKLVFSSYTGRYAEYLYCWCWNLPIEGPGVEQTHLFVDLLVIGEG